MTKPPEHVQLGPISYTLDFVKDLHDKEGTGVNGSFSTTSSSLKVESELRSDFRMVVMMHEIIHAMFEIAGREDEMRDEGLVDTLAYAVIDMIRQNPKLIAFIQEELNEVE